MKLSRRTMLRAGTTALMLPILEANSLAFSAAPEIPKRLVFLPMGYGVDPDSWFPKSKRTGADYVLPPSLEPFADLKSDFSILQNLTNRDIFNAHSGTTNFLTSAKRGKGGFKNTVSCDQLAANVLGEDTRHRCLAIASGAGKSDGHGGRFGYASWGENGKPIGVYRKLNQVYRVLFGNAGTNPNDVRQQLLRKKSSLDALVSNAKKLNGQISSADRNRVDEYFTMIRSIEERLSKAQEWVDNPYPDAPFTLPAKKVSGRQEIELTLDLMHIALQSDSTRVITYMLPTTAALRAVGSKLNPHKMSHFGAGKPQVLAVQQKRDLLFSEVVAGFLKKLKETKEHDGSSLLDHSLVAFGSGLRKNHNSKNGPMLLAGHGGGGLTQGRNVVYKANATPLANLWLSMIRHVGVDQDKFADSKRVLTEIGFE